MLQEFPTIYRAKNMQEAQLLVDLLEEEGIRATVTNSILENGSGVDIVGWPTLSRVMVAREDAVRARAIALQFDREVSGRESKIRPSIAWNAPGPEVVAPWPCCPECGQRRMTALPFLRHARQRFSARRHEHRRFARLADSARQGFFQLQLRTRRMRKSAS